MGSIPWPRRWQGRGCRPFGGSPTPLPDEAPRPGPHQPPPQSHLAPSLPVSPGPKRDSPRAPPLRLRLPSETCRSGGAGRRVQGLHRAALLPSQSPRPSRRPPADPRCFGACSPPRALAPSDIPRPPGVLGGTPHRNRLPSPGAASVTRAARRPRRPALASGRSSEGSRGKPQLPADTPPSAFRLRSAERHVRRADAAPGLGPRCPRRRKEPPCLRPGRAQPPPPARRAPAAARRHLHPPLPLAFRPCVEIPPTLKKKNFFFQRCARKRRRRFDHPRVKTQKFELAQSDLTWRRESFTERARVCGYGRYS